MSRRKEILHREGHSDLTSFFSDHSAPALHGAARQGCGLCETCHRAQVLLDLVSLVVGIDTRHFCTCPALGARLSGREDTRDILGHGLADAVLRGGSGFLESRHVHLGMEPTGPKVPTYSEIRLGAARKGPSQSRSLSWSCRGRRRGGAFALLPWEAETVVKGKGDDGLGGQGYAEDRDQG